jgi:DNA modification methylase
LLWKLEVEVPDLDLLDLGLEVAEIDLAYAANQDEVPEERKVESGPAVARLGDIFLLRKHRIIVGDATNLADITRLMNGRKANAMFTDPPYNVRINGFVSGNGQTQHREFPMASGEMDAQTFIGFLSAFIELACRFSIGGAIHFICMDWRHMRDLLEAATPHYGALLNLCIWAKDRPSLGSLWRSQHELVFAWRVGRERQRNNVQLGKFGRSRSNVWSYPSAATFLKSEEDGDLLKQHPTPKPVKLVADAILDCTKRGDIVLDSFAGTGTTIIAAERTGRVCYASELDPLYADLSIRRWQSLTGEWAIHEESGLTFDEIARLRSTEASDG